MEGRDANERRLELVVTAAPPRRGAGPEAVNRPDVIYFWYQSPCAAQNPCRRVALKLNVHVMASSTYFRRLCS